MLSDRLETLVNALGLKKRDFAEKVSFSQAYSSMILNGTRQNPSKRFYQCIKREFNIKWLRNGECKLFLVDSPNLSPVQQDLISKYNALPLSKRKMIDEAVDALWLNYS